MKKILIVDDDRSIREAMEFALESQGHQIISADSFNDELLDEAPDLIILDMLLSGHYGPDICRQLKSDEEVSDIPIIMISAHPSAKEAIRECGADGFISKPFELENLLSTIDKHLV